MSYVYQCERCCADIINYDWNKDVRIRDEAKGETLFKGTLCKDCKKKFFNELMIIKSKYNL